MTTECLFTEDKSEFLPTALAGSPWHPGILHGGAPAALFAYCFEKGVTPELVPARLSIDLLRPVPKAPLTVHTECVRRGKRIQLWQARMEAGGTLVALANALFVKQRPVQLPDYAPQIQPLNVSPDQLQDVCFGEILFSQAKNVPPGLHTCIRLRPVTPLQEKGRGAAWLSLPVDVIEARSTTPFMLAALASDFGNGVGQLNLGSETGTINADIQLMLSRPASGEWIGLQSEALMGSTGVGQVTTALFDTRGRIGQVVQTIMPMSDLS